MLNGQPTLPWSVTAFSPVSGDSPRACPFFHGQGPGWSELSHLLYQKDIDWSEASRNHRPKPIKENELVHIILIGAVLFASLVGAALLGRRVHRYLPEAHLSADSRDAVKLAMGLVATMTALVLGLLVSSAKGTYDTARSEVIQMAAKVAFLDRMLALYGPEAADARSQLRDPVPEAVQRTW